MDDELFRVARYSITGERRWLIVIPETHTQSISTMRYGSRDGENSTLK